MITVRNRQRRVAVDLEALQRFAERALAKVPLKELDQIDVILVSDRRIAGIHRQFMNEPGPTDVITFQHGEIFISTETARRQARQFGTTFDHELRLYLVHGLLHLQGFDDKTPDGVAEMKRRQERIVAALP